MNAIDDCVMMRAFSSLFAIRLCAVDSIVDVCWLDGFEKCASQREQKEREEEERTLMTRE